MNEVKTEVKVNIDTLFAKYGEVCKSNRRLTVATMGCLFLAAYKKAECVVKDKKIKELIKEIEELKAVKGD